MKSNKLLIVFIKNPELGKVKTRLARTIGAERALNVYKKLLTRTNQIAAQVNADKAVYYSDFIDDFDMWDDVIFEKHLQTGKSIGEGMYHAFKKAFDRGYKQVCAIGSDCYELSPWGIEEGFFALNKHEVVMGPTLEGSYYLLGLSKMREDLFVNKIWGGDNVLLDTILDLKKTSTPYSLLETLSDIHVEEDLGQLKKLTE